MSQLNSAQISDQHQLPIRPSQAPEKQWNWADERVYQYVLDTVTRPREHEASRELREITNRRLSDGRAMMMVPPDEAQLLRLLVKMSGAKRAIELGVMTGYSLLNIALALPADGTVIGVDSGDDFEIGRRLFEKAGVAHKVDFRKRKAIEVLDSLLQQEGGMDSLDFAFVDADKQSYVKYHERLMKLVRVGGVIVYDNTLCGGMVGWKDPLDKLQEDDGFMRSTLEGILAINKVLAEDRRVEIVMLGMADGVTICNKIE